MAMYFAQAGMPARPTRDGRMIVGSVGGVGVLGGGARASESAPLRWGVVGTGGIANRYDPLVPLN